MIVVISGVSIFFGVVKTSGVGVPGSSVVLSVTGVSGFIVAVVSVKCKNMSRIWV